MSKKIYLACPYSDPAPEVRQQRYEQVTEMCADLMRQGNVVFSPITYTHCMARDHSMPVEFEFWREMCRAFISWADVLWVLRLDGWEKSVGVQAESKEAQRQGKQVIYV